MIFINLSKNELLTGLNGLLSLVDNFNSKLVEDIEIPAGEEITIPNPFNPRIPKMRLIVRETGDDSRLVDGDAAWTAQKLSLKNTGTDDMVVSLLFMVS